MFDRAVPKGVFGTRVAYGLGGGRLVVADGPDGVPKEVAAVPNGLAFNDIVWSHDGRWIAATAYVGTPRVSPVKYTIKVLVVGVNPDGGVFSPAHLIDTPMIWMAWGLQWLRDGSAVTVTGQSPPSGRFDVWLVSLREGISPVALTRAERDFVGYNVVSPDGQYIAYRAQFERGTSLWLADLGDALTTFGSK